MKTIVISALFIVATSCISKYTSQVNVNPVLKGKTITLNKTDQGTITNSNLKPEQGVIVNTSGVGKVTASQADISYNIRLRDASQPVEHGVCLGTKPAPTIASRLTTVQRSYNTSTMYGHFNNLKPSVKYYARAYMKLLGTGVVYYGNELIFNTLDAPTN